MWLLCHLLLLRGGVIIKPRASPIPRLCISPKRTRPQPIYPPSSTPLPYPLLKTTPLPPSPPLLKTPSPYIAISTPPPPPSNQKNPTHTHTYLRSSILTDPTYLPKHKQRTKSPTTQPNPYNPLYLLYPPPPPKTTAKPTNQPSPYVQKPYPSNPTFSTF